MRRYIVERTGQALLALEGAVAEEVA